jgi:hypothetical protein
MYMSNEPFWFIHFAPCLCGNFSKFRPVWPGPQHRPPMMVINKGEEKRREKKVVPGQRMEWNEPIISIPSFQSTSAFVPSSPLSVDSWVSFFFSSSSTCLVTKALQSHSMEISDDFSIKQGFQLLTRFALKTYQMDLSWVHLKFNHIIANSLIL